MEVVLLVALVLAAAVAVVFRRMANGAEQRAVASETELTTIRELDLCRHPHATSVIDPETDLPDGRFFEVALESRVSAARRHLWPVTVVLLELDLPQGHEHSGALESFGRILRQTLRDADVACRIGTHHFALLLDDTGETGGVEAAERLQLALAAEHLAPQRFAAGVAGYPTHALEADEVMARARVALGCARAQEVRGAGATVAVASIDLS